MICTDKYSFPSLSTINFNNNAYDEFNDGFVDALLSACKKSETGVTIRAFQVSVEYPPMCSTTNADNYWYYDMTDSMEVAQCRFTWNWEVSDDSNVYASVGPFPNDNTNPCNPITTQPPVPIFVSPDDITNYPDTETTITTTGTISSSTSFILRGLPKLKSINIGDNCWRNTKTVELSYLSLLESIVIGKNSFSGEKSGSSYQIANCPKLQFIKIGADSFKNYQSFELINLPALQTIVIRKEGFKNAPFSLTSLID